MANRQYDNVGYSGLEVVPANHDGNDAPEHVPMLNDATTKPNNTFYNHNGDDAPEHVSMLNHATAKPDNAFYNQNGSGAPEYNGPYQATTNPENKLYSQSVSTAAGYNGPYQTPVVGHNVPEYNGPTEKARPTGFICGLSRIASWCIVVGIALVVIGAIVGGVVGGLTSHHSESTASKDGTSTPTTNATGPTSGPLAKSQLAAFNWTDSASTERRAVFYELDGALFLSQYFEGNKTWGAFNISATFDKSSTRLHVKSGTPLAVAAWSTNVYNAATGATGENFLLGLYFVDIENYLSEVNTRDEDLQTWNTGNLRGESILADDDSRLAAVAHICQDCTNALCVGYQDTDRVVRWTNNTAWDAQYAMDQAYPGTGLAAIPFGGANGNYSVANETRFFYDSNGAVEVSIFNQFGFNLGSNQGAVMSSQTVLNDQVPQLVATPATGHSEMLVMSMDGDGNVTASYATRGSSTWTNKATQFVNEQGTTTSQRPDLDLTSIAMNHNGAFYGITEDGTKIVEYSWDSSAPFSLTWAQNITVT